MKKTIPTSIANTLFYIEEDTYGELDAYLASIRLHFATYDDHIEIIKDIESRIAEQFIEYTSINSSPDSKRERIITKEHVDRLKKSMGMPEDFGDANTAEQASTEKHGNSDSTSQSSTARKFYRDTEHGIVGGICSGIAAYFGIDPVLVRVIFFIILIAGGAGFLIYIFLWIAIPEAKTASQKLEMQGDPVTLQSVGEMAKEKIKEKAEEIKGVGVKGKMKTIAEGLRNFFAAVANSIGPILGGIIGVALKIIAITAIIGITAAFIIGAMNPGAALVDLPIHTFIPLPVYYLSLGTLFFISIIPFFFVSALGSIFLRKKTLLRGLAGTIMLTIWMVAIIVGIVTAASVSRTVESYVATNPSYQKTSQIIQLAAYNRLIAQNAQHITIVSGPEYKATISGRSVDIGRINFDVENDTLRIRTKDNLHLCFFCWTRTPNIELTVPSPLTSLVSANASKIHYEGTFTNLSLELENASMMYLKGTAESLTASLENASRLDAKDLVTREADLTLQNASKAEVNVQTDLKIKSKNASKTIQYGQASIDDAETDNASSVVKQ